jgi:hypothetical protein
MSIKSDKATVEKMIRLYCRLKHKSADLCVDCFELKTYAHKKLDDCRYANQKPSCKKCTTHCYKKEQRDKIKKVMRFSGSRMLLYYPLDFFKHLFK